MGGAHESFAEVRRGGPLARAAHVQSVLLPVWVGASGPAGRGLRTTPGPIATPTCPSSRVPLELPAGTQACCVCRCSDWELRLRACRVCNTSPCTGPMLLVPCMLRVQTQRLAAEVKGLQDSERDLYRSERLGIWTKLRPGARNFLARAAEKFELWVYSSGSRCVARGCCCCCCCCC